MNEGMVFSVFYFGSGPQIASSAEETEGRGKGERRHAYLQIDLADLVCLEGAA